MKKSVCIHWDKSNNRATLLCNHHGLTIYLFSSHFSGVTKDNRIYRTSLVRVFHPLGVDALDYMDKRRTSIPSFVQDLPDVVFQTPGICINIRGFVRPDCSRFAINLSCSKDPNSDLALHINPRFSQRYVVRNSRKRGDWGEEQVTSVSKFPLQRNSPFELDILTTDIDFLIAINGKHIAAFPFRIPLAKVKYLQIEGDVDVLGISYLQCEVYPRPSSVNAPYTVSYGGDEVGEEAPKQLDIPLTASLVKGFQKGWQLEIKGRVKILPEEFFVNLQNGGQVWPEPKIFLHVNPRFRTLRAEQLFIKNAKIDGNWGQEERSSSFQFGPASPFSLAIRKESDHFSIWVDGQLSGEFNFRGNVAEIDTVYIQGDIVVEEIRMRDSKEDKYFNKSFDSNVA